MANQSELEDDAVVDRVRHGETDLFEVVMRRYNQRVYRVVRAIVRDDDEASDVTQEAHVNAFMHLREFSGRARFSTWLTRIAVHEALARVRRRSRLESLEDTDSEDALMTSTTPGPEDRASDGELRVLLERAVDSLPEVFRTTFVLRSIENLSVAETAEILGVPEDTVKTRHYRARERLQSWLTHRVGGALPSLFDFDGERCDLVVSSVLQRLKDPPPEPPAPWPAEPPSG
jgi:RNA polymerase sigma-70 factor, ECF subfamily